MSAIRAIADASLDNEPRFTSERISSSPATRKIKLIGKFSRGHRRQEAIIEDISARWNARQIEPFSDQLQVILEFLLVDGANSVRSSEW